MRTAAECGLLIGLRVAAMGVAFLPIRPALWALDRMSTFAFGALEHADFTSTTGERVRL